MKTLFLHIGMPKAGSTTIQETLFARRLDLAAVGIHYPDLGPSHSKIFLALFSPKKMKLRPRVIGHLGFDKASQDYDLGDLERLLTDELTRTDAETVITSGEMLFGFKAGQCRDLRSVLAPHFDRIRIVVYLRDPISLANSRAQQNVKGGQSTIAEMGDPEAIRAGRSPLVPRYREPIENWSDAFGPDALILREFDPRAFVGGDLMVDFGQVVGIPDALARDMSGLRSKVARNAEAVEILNRYLERTPLADRDRFPELRDLIGELPGSRFTLPRATLEAVEAAAEPEVEWLRIRTGRDLFRRAGPMTATPEPGWSEETRAALQAILEPVPSGSKRSGRNGPARASEPGAFPPGSVDSIRSGHALGAPVPAIGDLASTDRAAAIDELLDRLLAALPRKKAKTKAKFKRGRIGRWLALAAGVPGYLRQRFRRFVKRRFRGRGGLGDPA